MLFKDANLSEKISAKIEFRKIDPWSAFGSEVINFGSLPNEALSSGVG
jgi:hypothetical protein